MRQTDPQRRVIGYGYIDPTRAHVLQAPLSLRVGSKARKPSGGGWTYVPPPKDAGAGR